jgi:hypothetical protein
MSVLFALIVGGAVGFVLGHVHFSRVQHEPRLHTLSRLLPLNEPAIELPRMANGCHVPSADENSRYMRNWTRAGRQNRDT